MFSPIKMQQSVRFTETASLVFTEKSSKEEFAIRWYSGQERQCLKHLLMQDMQELWQQRATEPVPSVILENSWEHIGIAVSLQEFMLRHEQKANHSRAIIAAQESQRRRCRHDAIELSQLSQRSSEFSRAQALEIAVLSIGML